MHLHGTLVHQYTYVNDGLAQDCERTSSLIGSRIYDTEGTARLVELSDGSLEFRLESDFMTNRGPDVQIFLSNDSVSVAGATMIADIAELGHFSGARSFPVPDGVSISDFDHIVFRCFAFRAHWGSCLLYTSPSPRDLSTSRMPSSA